MFAIILSTLKTLTSQFEEVSHSESDSTYDLLLHPSPLLSLKSSHSSIPTIKPSPVIYLHVSFYSELPPEQFQPVSCLQSDEQPSELRVFSSSHSSELF